jgi:hypothetical protein
MKERGLKEILETNEQFKIVEKEYRSLKIRYKVAKAPCYKYGIISDELDIASIYEIRNLEFTDTRTGESRDLNEFIPPDFKLGIVRNGGSKVIRHKKLITIANLGEYGNQFALFSRNRTC